MSFTCPICEKTSHNPNDERERYCDNCKAFTREIGRELKVSELKPGMVVVVHKPGHPMGTAGVVAVRSRWIQFRTGVAREFLAQRIGEGIRDDGQPLMVYQYLPTS
jgi:hypothetical protein